MRIAARFALGPLAVWISVWSAAWFGTVVMRVSGDLLFADAARVLHTLSPPFCRRSFPGFRSGCERTVPSGSAMAAVRRCALLLGVLHMSRGAPRTAENERWNVNLETRHAPDEYYGGWPGHTYHPSPADWRALPIYQLLTDRSSTELMSETFRGVCLRCPTRAAQIRRP